MQTKRKVVLQVLVIVLRMLRKPGLLFLNAASSNCQDQDFVMLLPKERDEAASMMTVVKPFNAGLWCTIAGFYIYTVSVVWLLEQRKRSEQGSNLSSKEVLFHICFFLVFIYSSGAINMSLSSFSFQKRSARIVLSVWRLVVSVLAIGYITNFIVMLNGQKVYVSEIIASGAIGYLKENFSPSNQVWSEKNLKAYTTEEECAQALSQGPNRGGVGVILMDRLHALHFISLRSGYTYYDIPPQADTPRSLGVLDFKVWFIFTGAVSTVGLIIFIYHLVCTAQSAGSGRRAPVTDPSEIVTQSDLVRHRAPATDTAETRPENRAATPNPAEGNASWGNDDEDSGDDDEFYERCWDHGADFPTSHTREELSL